MAHRVCYGRVNGSFSEWVRDVCMSHQSDRIYYKQPIKFLVLKVNGMWEDSILIQFRTAIFILLWKRRKYLFPHFLWVMRRILVMDEMSLEVWDSAWACCMQMQLYFIFSSKSNMILTIATAENDCFGLFACKYSEILFYFWVTKGNLTLLFFTRE